MGVSCANAVSKATFSNNSTAKCSLRLKSNSFVKTSKSCRKFRSRVIKRGANRRFSVAMRFPRKCPDTSLTKGPTGFRVMLGGVCRGMTPRLASR